MIPTTQEKIAAVERLIADFRIWRHGPDGVEYQTYLALKAIDADLRARLAGVPGVAEHELGRRVGAVVMNGSTTDRLNALAHELIRRWPVVKQALERFGEEVSP